jgi:hypothetical protein
LPASHRCLTAEDFEADAGALTILGIETLPQVMWHRGSCGTTADTDSSYLLEYANYNEDSCRLACETNSQCAGAELVFETPRVGESLGDCRLFSVCLPEIKDTTGPHSGSMVLLKSGRYRYREATCISGQTCAIPGAQNFALDVLDQVRILDTCGGFEREGGRSVASVQGGKLVFAEVVTLPGGQYRLCWCADPRGCHATWQFAQDVGSLSVLGPYAGQTFTCVSGRPCEIDSLGGRSLLDIDTVLVLETCGTLSALPFPGGEPSREPRIPGVDAPYAVHPQASFPNVTHSGAALMWEMVTARGGLYRLCWCSGFARSCDDATKFVTDAGALHIIGPRPVPRTCVAGRTCAFDGIPGYHLAEADAYLVLDTCATAARSTWSCQVDRTDTVKTPLCDPVVRTVEHEERKYLGLPIPRGDPLGSSGPRLSTNSGQSIAWPDWNSAVAGRYRLCWCRGSCHTSEDFRTDAGEFSTSAHTRRTSLASQASGAASPMSGV